MRRLMVIAMSLLLGAAGYPVRAAAPVAEGQVQIVAPKMCCAGCAKKVSGQLYAIRGVKNVEAELASHTVTVAMPATSPAMLGVLWHSVEKGGGGPTSLITTTATYRLDVPQDEAATKAAHQLGTTQQIVVEHLDAECVQKIASQLYAIKAVGKVSTDMEHAMIAVEPKAGESVSPWTIVEVLTQVQERPLSVSGNYGTLSIEWAEVAPHDDHSHAFVPAQQGIQR